MRLLPRVLRPCSLSALLAPVLIALCFGSLQTSATAAESLSKTLSKTKAQPHVHVVGQPCTECANALRAQQIARLRYLIYFRSGHRLEMARLDSEIRLVQAQLRSAKKVNADYKRLNGYWTRHSRPFPVTEERSHLAVVDLDLRLKLLRKERLYAIQDHQLKIRLRRLEIEQLVSALKNPIAVTTL